jgi:hypothetical protein
MITAKRYKREDLIVIDGEGGAKFERVMHGESPAILISHPDLPKTIMITGPVIAGVNGWLARFVKEIEKATRH